MAKLKEEIHSGPQLTPEHTKAINELMALPGRVTTDDGRELRIIAWQPIYSNAEATILVRMEAVVARPQDIEVLKREIRPSE